MSKRVLFLDAFGTLLSGGVEAIHETCEEIVRNNSLDMSPHDFLRVWDGHYKELLGGDFLPIWRANEISLIRTYQQLGIEDDVDGYLRRMYESWYRARLYEDAKRALQRIAKVTKCMISNADEHLLRTVMKRNGLRFEHSISSERAKAYKPYPAIFKFALAEVGCKADDVLMVGDSQTSDILGGKRMGISVIWVNRMNEELREGIPEPDHEVADLVEMTNVLAEEGYFSLEE